MERERYTTRPEWLAQFLSQEIDELLCTDYSEYGIILYERVGTIRFLVDGSLFYEFDVARQLAELRKSDQANTYGCLLMRKDI